jgi:hypothetical protein
MTAIEVTLNDSSVPETVKLDVVAVAASVAYSTVAVGVLAPGGPFRQVRSIALPAAGVAVKSYDGNGSVWHLKYRMAFRFYLRSLRRLSA